MLANQGPLEAHVRWQDRVAVIDLHGEINALSTDVLQEIYSQAEAGQPQAILLNFAQVEYINSTGIALIVGLLAKARQAHIPVMTCGLSNHYKEIFQITRLSDFMAIYDDEASALAEGTTEE